MLPRLGHLFGSPEWRKRSDRISAYGEGMTSFENQDLAGSTFRDVTLRGAQFRAVDLRDASLRGVWLNGTVMRGVELVGVDIDGEVANLRINGVDVGPLIEAELDRRDPDREKMRPVDAEGFRQAWEVVERRWAQTLERARGFTADELHESVDSEWSFISTLRHLLYATDVWVNRVLLGNPRPWHPLDLPFDEMEPHPEVPWDRDARPTLEAVLELRADRMATVRRVLADLSDERLDAMTEPVEGPGWPQAQAFPVREALLTVLNEEWLHRSYAERDLSAIAKRKDASS